MTRHARSLGILVALACAGGCDDDDGAGGRGADAGARLACEAFERRAVLGDGAELTAGVTHQGEAVRGDLGAAADLVPAAWRRVFVELGAAAGGDGSPGAPFSSLDAAIAAIGGEPAALVLGPGRFAGPIEAGGDLAVVGTCASLTIVVGGIRSRPDAAGPRDRTLVVAELTVDGGDDNLTAQHLHRLYVRQARLQAATGVGLRAYDVATVDVRDSWINGAGARHLDATEAAVAVQRTIVGPGPGAGIIVGTTGDAPPDDAAGCPGGSPVCPYGSMLYVDASLIRQVGLRGIEARYAQAVVRRTQVDGVGGAGDAVGVSLVRSFGVIDGATALTGVLGRGVELRSARAHVEGVHVSDGVVGLSVRREGAPGDSGEPGLTWHPSCDVVPAPDFAAVDGAAFEGAGWAMPEAWFPETDGLGQGELPPGLTAGADQIAEYPLHHWARAEVSDFTATDTVLGGVALSGHPVRMRGVRITGVGAQAYAFTAGAASTADYRRPGADLVGVSSVADLSVRGVSGPGVRLRAAGLFSTRAAEPALLLPVTEQLSGAEAYRGAFSLTGLRLEGTRGTGVQLEDSLVRLDDWELLDVAGMGVRLQGAYVDGRNLRVSGVEAMDLTDREGAALPGVADGLVIDGSTLTGGQGTRSAVQITDLSVIGAARVGLFVAQDVVQLGVSVERGAGRFEDNALDGALLGPADLVEVVGLELQAVDVGQLNPPGLVEP